jgi:hypothetical protein
MHGAPGRIISDFMSPPWWRDLPTTGSAEWLRFGLDNTCRAVLPPRYSTWKESIKFRALYLLSMNASPGMESGWPMQVSDGSNADGEYGRE